MPAQQKPSTQKKTKNPCKRMYFDFQICVKKLGFNDRQCKYYLEKYESCVKKTQNL